MSIEYLLDDDINDRDVKKAIANVIKSMTKKDILKYVVANMFDYYTMVADIDETNEFLETHNDTSVWYKA
jgi:hypothetical protein